MKQLYHTSCKLGQSVGGGSGYQTRAVTVGVSVGRVRPLLRFVGYEIPLAEVDREELPRAAPVRLAFCDIPNFGQIVVHSVYAGRDPTTGRDGNYFTHLLFDVPNEVTAQDVIQTWESMEWRTRDSDELTTEIPPRDSLPAHGPLSVQRLRTFLRDESHQKMFRFLVNAWLLRESDTRIFLAAKSGDIAVCIFGLLRCLPPQLTAGLTFSTYEKNPLASYAQIVGTWWGKRAARDLPAACYQGRCFGYNDFRDRPPNLPCELEFANFVVSRCRTGEIEQIEEFCRELPSDAFRQGRRLDLLYRVHREPDSLTADDLREATLNLGLSSWVVNQPKRLREITDGALAKDEYARRVYRKIVEDTAGERRHVRRLAEAARECCHHAARTGKIDLLRGYFGHLLRILPAPIAAEFQDEVWGDFPDPATLSWKVHRYLLPYAMHRCAETDDQHGVQQWLTVPANHLESLLAMRHLDDEHRVRACVNCLRTKSAKSMVQTMLVKRPTLAVPTLATALRLLSGDAADRAVAVYRHVVRNAKSDRPGRDLIEWSSQFEDPRTLDTCLDAALKARALTSVDLARAYNAGLGLLRDRWLSLADDITQRFGLADLVQDRSLWPLLDDVGRQRDLAGALKRRLTACRALRRFADVFDFDTKTLKEVAALVREEEHDGKFRGLRTFVHQQAADALLYRRGRHEPWRPLERCVECLSETEAERAANYRALLDHCREDAEFANDPHLIHAFIAYGFGVPANIHDLPRKPYLRGEAVKLARQLARRGRRRVFQAVDAQTQRYWRSHGALARYEEWKDLAHEIRPGWFIRKRPQAASNSRSDRVTAGGATEIRGTSPTGCAGPAKIFLVLGGVFAVCVVWAIKTGHVPRWLWWLFERLLLLIE